MNSKKIIDYFYSENLNLYKETSAGIFSVSLLRELENIFQKLNLPKEFSFVDLGSGDGRVVFLASLFFAKSCGVELDKELYSVSEHRKKILKNDIGVCEFINSDFMSINLNMYDLVYINPDRPFYRDDLEKFLLKFNTNFLMDISLFAPRFMKAEKIFDFSPKKYAFYSKKR
ncbi:hypothetical protein JXM83_01530 [Candidatus Woesearchaeota archaeon]|nr:hypothetical protein [Candidatus Woesearchaeota archaeon]